MTKHTNTPPRWVDGAIIYQVYPRSFKDNNGDGVGDLPGVTSKLDYLKDLGINGIWLSPFYPSPMHDFGYDISDYCDVDPVFGTLADFKKLLKESHARDIRIMVDLVPNHTSDEHEWFKASSASKNNDYTDWYIWRDAKGTDKNGKPLPPNNWTEVFNGRTAWEWHEKRQQFYLHSFDIHQPDLNWDNPKVREAIKDVMRFWLDLGVDGFRVDAVNFIAKDYTLPDDPPNPDFTGTQHHYGKLNHDFSQGLPQLYPYLNELADVLKEEAYAERHPFMVTEGYPRGDDHIADYMAYYRGMDPSVAAPFNFEGLALPHTSSIWSAFLERFHQKLDEFDKQTVASYAFSNHDNSRIVSRLGSEAQARSAAVLLLTLPGMAFIYNGDELGMHDVHIPPELAHDPEAVDGPGRDPERTPLQWTSGKLAGFTDGDKTWLPVADDYKTLNAETEAADPGSFLSLYQNLAKLRAESTVIKHGDITVLDPTTEMLAYKRHDDSGAYLILINFTDLIASYDFDDTAELVLSSNPSTELTGSHKGSIKLGPYEAAIFSLD